jgi:chemotaxis protein CheD
MSQIVVAEAPDVLVTLGLGSCVAVCVYDFFLKVGGMAHVMLPNSSLTKEVTTPGKFADTAISALLTTMRQKGALKERLEVKIAGGAQMFSYQGLDQKIQIGVRNISAVEENLAQSGLKISKRSVGGNIGRSVFMELATGAVRVKMLNSPDHIL